MTKITTYDTIENPYNVFLERSNNITSSTDRSLVDLGDESNDSDTSSSGIASAATNTNGSNQVQSVKSDGAIGDVWIRNFIRSENWKPSTQGFAIDGQTGFAEFHNVSIVGNIRALTGTIGGFVIGATDLKSTFNGYTTILSSGPIAFSSGPTGGPTVTISQAGLLTAVAGSIGGWNITTDLLRSANSGARIELNTTKNRISIFDAVNEKVVMGYLDGLSKHDGTGNWGPGDYGFWALTGDKLSIDGDGEYTSGDWIIQHDAAYLIKDASNNTIIRLGTDAGEKGLFLYNTSGVTLAKYTSDEIFIGDINNYVQYDTVTGLNIKGNITITGGNASITFYQADEPTTGMKNGDYWIDSDDNSLHIYQGAWILITSAGGAKVFMAEPTTPYHIGDLWMTSTGDATGDLKKCIVERLTGAYVAADWVLATDYTEGATWGTNLNNIPATLGAPDGTGLFLSSTNMGYYDAGAWKTYMDSSGNFALGDIAGTGSSLYWNQSLGDLTIQGDILATTGRFGSLANYWNVGATGLTGVATDNDVIINYGKTDFGQDSTPGFILGYDFSALTSKFEIGASSSVQMKYDGTNFSIIGGIITGGLIRTDTNSTRIELRNDTNSMLFYDGGYKISEMDPSSSQGIGFTQWFYDNTQTDNDVGKFYYRYMDYAAPIGQYKSQEVGMFLNSFTGSTGVSISLFSDNQDPTKIKMWLSGRLNGNIACYDNSNGLGTSTIPFRSIYAMTVYYQNLTTFSDERLKKDITPTKYGLKELLKINPIDFTWKRDNKKGHGFSAQDLRKIFPDVVQKAIDIEETFEEDSKGRKIRKTKEVEVKIDDDPNGESALTVDMATIFPVLVKSIQELNKMVEDLQDDVRKLKKPK